MTYPRKKIKKALLKKGFEEYKQGSDHHRYVLVNPGGGYEISINTKISRGSKYKDYGPQLLDKMANQLKLTNRQLKKYLDCEISKENYYVILTEKGII